MATNETSGKEGDESTENNTERHAVALDGGEESTCDECGCLSNVFRGFVHDVADESWTGHDVLCRECFIAVGSNGDEEEPR